MKSGMVGALALIAVVVLAVAGSALAKPPKKYDSEITITSSNQGTLFEGTVTSESPKCEKNRDVSLVYDTTGATVGTATTDADGNWSMPGSFTAGLYHGVVEKEKVGKKTKCLADEGIKMEF